MAKDISPKRALNANQAAVIVNVSMYASVWVRVTVCVSVCLGMCGKSKFS